MCLRQKAKHATFCSWRTNDEEILEALRGEILPERRFVFSLNRGSFCSFEMFFVLQGKYTCENRVDHVFVLRCFSELTNLKKQDQVQQNFADIRKRSEAVCRERGAHSPGGF